jgi:hypothetical protein
VALTDNSDNIFYIPRLLYKCTQTSIQGFFLGVMDLKTKMRTVLEETEYFGLLKQKEGSLELRKI